MIMKDMVISITGVQAGPEGPEALELITHGSYGQEKDKTTICYEETDLLGEEGTKVTFQVSPRRVELTREGEVKSHMVFEEGQKNYCLYETPFGDLTMGINTNRVRSRMGPRGGYMELDYLLDLNASPVGRSRFHIFVKEPEESHSGDVRWPI